MVEHMYWNGNGKYQKEYQEMYDKLVPAVGESDTKLGELIRIASKAYYRYNNDGDIRSYRFFSMAKSIEKDIKKEMPQPEEYDTWKRLVNEYKGDGNSNSYSFKFHKQEYEKAMEATIDGLVKYAYKVFKSGNLKHRLVNVELIPPRMSKFGNVFVSEWILVKSSGERINFPSKEKAIEYSKKKGWKVHEENIHKVRRRYR